MSDKREWDVALKAIESATEAERNEYRSDIAVLRAQVQTLQSAPGLSAQKIFKLDAEIARLRPYVEAFQREETRADRAEQKIDDLNDEIASLRAQLESARKAMQEACDLLAERTYGSNARSPGHNARLKLEAALTDEKST